ncbi:MAG: PaaI family thioesterase [Halioglobus sp.]
MTEEEKMQQFFDEAFLENEILIEKLGNNEAHVRRKVGPNSLRPGGTVSGLFMMTVADSAMYAAILGEIGLVALAVTTNLNINFLRKPAGDKDVLAHCTLLKLGKALAVCEVTLFSEGLTEPIAHAVGTYSIPPKQ